MTTQILEARFRRRGTKRSWKDLTICSLRSFPKVPITVLHFHQHILFVWGLVYLIFGNSSLTVVYSIALQYPSTGPALLVSLKMSHSHSPPDEASPVSTDPSTYAFVDRDDDDARSTTTGASFSDDPDPTGHWVALMRKEGHCMRLYAAVGNPALIRVCGCRGTCTRTLPSPHKDGNDDPSTHGADGFYMTVPPSRKDSPYVDGLLLSYRTPAERLADLARHSEENVTAARALNATSPANSRNFQEEEESVGVTPRRDNLAPPETTRKATPRGLSGRTSLGILGMAGGGLRSAGSTGRFKTPPPLPNSVMGPRTGNVNVATANSLDQIAQLLTSQIAENRSFNTTVLQALMANRGTDPQADATATDEDDDVLSDDDSCLGSIAVKAPPKARKARGSQKTRRAGKKGKGRKGEKATPLWFGVVAGEAGSLHRSEAGARTRAREFRPRGRISSAFTTKEAARTWIAQNLEDPSTSEGDSTEDSSGSEEYTTAPSASKKGHSNVVPPPPPASAKDDRLYEFVTQDKSIGTKNEIFGIGMKKERALFTALAPKGSSDTIMRSLGECIVDGTALPGTYSGSGVSVLDEGGESGNRQLAETISHAFNVTHGGQGIVGNVRRCDTGYASPRRISLKQVKNIEGLHELEREVGRAIPNAIENMELAFGSALDSFGWTDEDLERYMAGGLMPFIGIHSMRLYADLIRELACRIVDGWERVKMDVQYFCKKLALIRVSAPSRLLCICRTYVFLRDQKANNFTSLDRYGSHFTALYALVNEQRGGEPAISCAKCKQRQLHPGGRTVCPFKDVTDAKARLAGTLAAVKVAGGMSKTKATEEALAEVL